MILDLTHLGPHLPVSEAGGVEFNRKFCRMVHWGRICLLARVHVLLLIIRFRNTNVLINNNFSLPKLRYRNPHQVRSSQYVSPWSRRRNATASHSSHGMGRQMGASRSPVHSVSERLVETFIPGACCR